MDAAKNRISLGLGVPGLIFQIAGFVFTGQGESEPVMALVGLLTLLLGTALLIAGLAFYAAAKGHNPVWGLMGFLGIIGLIVLAVLPDRGDAARRLAAVAHHFPPGATPPTEQGPLFPSAPPPSGVLARWSLILSILSLSTFCVPLLPILFAAPAVILGHMAVSRNSKNPEAHTGRGMAIAGLVIGYVGLLIGLAMTMMILVVVLMEPR